MMLEVENIHTYYGQSHILQGVSLRVKEGEIVLLSGSEMVRERLRPFGAS